MNPKLLREFLQEDCDPAASAELLKAIRGAKPHGPSKQEFTFNRFKVTLDFEAQQAFIEDDLNVGDEGEYKLGLEEFATRLEKPR